MRYHNHVRVCRLKKRLTQKDVAIRSQKYLFRVKGHYDLRKIPEKLRKQFQKHGYPLSKNARIKIQKPNWIICDKQPKYVLKKSLFQKFLHIHDIGVSEITVARLDRKEIKTPRSITMQKVAKGIGDKVYKVFPPIRF